MKPLKISITGPESSGKSTLALALATRHGGAYVHEYAREYLADLGREYNVDDVVQIAMGQAALEDSFANNETPVLFCDTDMLVCKIWAEYKYGFCPEWIENAFATRHYDLTILCAPDIPWEPDPLRENPDPEERWELFVLYENALKTYGKKYVVARGDLEGRMMSYELRIEN